MPIHIINRCLTLHEFKDYVSVYDFGSRPAKKLVIHHTWRPTKERWAGVRSIQGLKTYYEGKGWPAGPHLFIAEDGIWLFSPMNQDGIHATSLNPGSIGIEVVGDYDQEVWSGRTKENALGSLKLLTSKLNLKETDIYFHRDVSSKTCPGTSITKEWLIAEVKQFRFLPQIPKSVPSGILNISAPVPDQPPPSLMIPMWAVEAVSWVKQHQLFEIKDEADVRDALKFYRFYQLTQNQNGSK